MKISSLILISLVAFPLSAKEAWDRIQETKQLRWGVDTNGGAPYAFPDPEKPLRTIGFEVDIMEAIGRALGVKVIPVIISWDQIVPSLLRDDFDIALNGLEVTRERSQTIDFTDPYYIFSEQITTRKGDKRFKRFEDLRGHRVGTLSTSLAHSLMLEDGRIKAVDYSGCIEPYKDLEIGRIDAVFMDAPIAAYYAQDNPKLHNIPQVVGEGFYAGGLRRDSPHLREKFNEALAAISQSGELKQIYKKWNMWTKTQEKLKKSDSPTEARSTGGASLWKFTPLLLKGAGVTVVISCLAMVVAIFFGFTLCMGKLYGNKVLQSLSSGYIEIIRGTPLLIQLYIIYYGLPNIGIELNAFVAAILGMGLNYAAYEAEIYRAGLLSVGKGQWEAARSIGMTGPQSLFYIVLPQSIKTIIPPSTNDFIALFKDTSLVSVITVVELTKMYNQAASTTYRFLELGLITAVLYFAMSYPLSLWSRHLEKRQHAI